MEATALKAVERFEPPAEGVARRDAVKSLVDAVSTDLAQRIKSVHGKADALEQAMLASAAKAKGILDEHLAVCQLLDEETRHLDSLLDKMTQEHTAT